MTEMRPNRIVELSSLIQEHTQKIDAYLTAEKLPTPSFDISAPLRLPLPPDLQASQEAVLGASDELRALLLGPAASIASHHHNSWVSAQAIQRFGIAKSFPLKETSTFAAIAKACSISESDARRILRHAMTYYVFRETTPGVVAHTAASKALAQAPLLGQLVGFLSGEMWPSATRVVDAMERWPESEEPNEAGFALAYDTKLPMFEVVGNDPRRASQMADAMTFMHSGPGYSTKHLLEGFSWEALATGMLVDVGGGRGAVAVDVARHFPGIRCVVQDLPDVIDGAKVPEDLKEGNRLLFMAHNFFQEQPVKHADAYLLRWILHDWSDKYAVKILRALIPALKSGARVLISELCLPPPCVLSPYKERNARNFDIAMKGIQNAKERDAEDWSQLFEFADARFKPQPITKPQGSNLSFIHAIWEGTEEDKP